MRTNVTQQCHLSLSENGKWQICFPRVRRWSPRRCRITLQNVAYECQTTPSGNEKRTNVTQQCHLSLSENGKWQICFPRVRRWSPRRCRITLQNVAYECQTTPSGNEKRTKRFPRVQNTLLRSKRGQNATLREYMITYGIDNVSGKARTYSSKSGKSTPKNLP